MGNKTFRQLYMEQKQKPTAAQVFVSEVASLTKRSEATVRMWIMGQQAPDELAQSIIADRFGVEAASLFPKES